MMQVYWISSVLCIILQCFLVADGLLREGSACGEGGVCQRVKNCAAAIRSLTLFNSPMLKRCGFAGRDEVVCCPPESRAPTEEIVFTTRKSEKLCNQISEDIRSLPTPNIFGGEDAEENEFPHMAALGYEDRISEEIEFNCGASILSERFVLTAAHCCYPRGSVLKLVRLGVTKLDDNNPILYYVKKVIIHPEYNPNTKYNDIALIEVNSTIIFNKIIYPACLYLKNDTPNALIVTGWGKRSSALRNDKSNILQKVTVVPTPQDICRSMFIKRNITTIIHTQICAGSNDTDACEGDSGGPLQIKNQNGLYSVVGVVSTGLPCQDITPGIYTRVSEYIDWIESTVWPTS